MTHALARLERALAAQRDAPLVRICGVLSEVAPRFCRARGLSAHVALGDRVRVQTMPPVTGEVLGIDADSIVLSLHETGVGLAPGLVVVHEGTPSIAPDLTWRGRVINALARPIDGRGPLAQGVPRSLDAPPPPSLSRARVTTPLRTGVRVVDAFTPLCHGQRMGVFAGSGVGKSTLLAMLARTQGFDTIVVALVGERGREVREVLEGALADRRADTVAVVATADESAAMRRLAAKSAMAIAEHFRDAGHAVLLVVDSVTRYAQAAREIGLAAGEPAVARGFPPSVFADLPRLLERAGPGLDRPGRECGTITAFFAVLVDGDDHNDPVADAIRSTLDGHLVLDRAIADSGRYPAVDLLRSISRLAHHAWSADERVFVRHLRALVARYEETRDLRAMGGYVPGGDAALDEAVTLVPKLYAMLGQDVGDAASLDAFAEVRAAIGD